MGDSMVRTLLLALVVALSTIGSGMAGPFEDGLAAYKRQDYATALRLWKPLAEQGDARAQTRLGSTYVLGEGVPQDYAEAMQWYRKAAEQGHAPAQNNLGVMYEKGLGVRRDYAEAMQWYRKAAEQGDARAQHNLGVMYEKGLGVPQDYAEAVRLWKPLAEQGNADAQNNLGVMYENGQGVPQDYVLAHVWFNLSASRQTDPENRERTAKARDRVAAKMTPAQITEAQRRAREWKPMPER